MGTSRSAPVALALASALVACGGDGAATTGTAPSFASTGTSPSSTSVSAAPSDVSVPAALQFSAPAVGGGAIDFTQFAGKPVVLWFWAPT